MVKIEQLQVDNIVSAINNRAKKVAATTVDDGLLSAADKAKLDGVAASANNYVLPNTVVHETEKFALDGTDALRVSGTTLSLYKGDGSFESVTTQDTVYTHPTTDGDLHVPATGTTNSGKVLTAGATAGSLTWTTPGSSVTLLSLGVNSTAGELNHSVGVTSAIQTQLAAKSPVAGSSSITALGTVATGSWNATAIPVLKGGTGATAVTGTGNNVLSTSPTLVTPILGTPTSGNLANCTFPTLNQDTTGVASTAFAIRVSAMGASIDLDTKIASGRFHQPANAQATLVLHYPVALAGYLEVVASDVMIYQSYFVYDSDDIYVRSKYSTNAWKAWSKLLNTTDSINASTVNSLTVQTAVPAGALFTDTVYTLPVSVVHDTEAGALHATDALRVSGTTLSLYRGDGTFESITTQDTDTVYTHPANHSASIITQDLNNRFVTDAEKATWNAKAPTDTVTTTANGLMIFGDKVKLDAVSGSNTGDETLATIKTKLGITTLSGSNTGDQTTITGNAGTVTNGVYTTGIQSIAGVKTFTDIPVFNGGVSGTSAPFAVGSTTLVTNLNAATVNSLTIQTAVPAGAVFTDTVYTHPATAGNLHIPSAGAAGQILRWSAAGTAVWGADTDTVYTHPNTDGNLHVPATGTTNSGKVLTAGATTGSLSWTTPAVGATNLSYTASPTNGVVVSDTGTDATMSVANGTNAGLMAPADFTKLVTDGWALHWSGDATSVAHIPNNDNNMYEYLVLFQATTGAYGLSSIYSSRMLVNYNLATNDSSSLGSSHWSFSYNYYAYYSYPSSAFFAGRGTAAQGVATAYYIKKIYKRKVGTV